MLVLGLACSNAKAMFTPVDAWPALYKDLVGEVPQPPTASAETEEVLRSYASRINTAVSLLSEKINESRLDAIVVIGDDLGAIFTGVQIPQICVYTGSEITGLVHGAESEGTESLEMEVTLPCHQVLGLALNEGLVEHGFDVTYSQFLRYESSDKNQRIGAQSIVSPMVRLAPSSPVPIVPIFLNTRRWPAPSGHRCYELGEAIASVLNARPERVAILAVGGLSNDPAGPRAGWVDSPLDRWVLGQLTRSQGAKLRTIFDVDSDAVRGGTGALRHWITVAGACESMGGVATVVDYLPVHHAATGLAFTYWSFSSR